MNIFKKLEWLDTSTSLTSFQMSDKISKYVGIIQAKFFLLVKKEIEDHDLGRMAKRLKSF